MVNNDDLANARLAAANQWFRDEIKRLTLTDDERAAIERGLESLDGVEDMSADASRLDAKAAATLRWLLKRTAV